MKQVARGQTLDILRISEKGEAQRLVMERARELRGRIIASLMHGDKLYDIVILVENGKMLAFSVNQEKRSIEELVDVLAEADKGFIELQSLDKAGIELEKEYNAEYLLEEPVNLDAILSMKTTIREPGAREERLESETTTIREQEQVAQIGESQVEEVGVVQGQPEHIEAEAIEEMKESKKEDTSVTVNIVERAVSEREATVGETAGENSLQEAGEAVIGVEATRVDHVKVGVLVEKELNELVKMLKEAAEPEVLDKCSENIVNSIVNAYLVIVKTEKIFRKIPAENIPEEIMKILHELSDIDDYIRFVISFGDKSKPSYDLLILGHRGRLLVLLLVDHDNPLEVVLKGKEVIEKLNQILEDQTILGGAAYTVPKQALDPYLNCDETESKRAEKPKRTKRRSLFSIFFGR